LNERKDDLAKRSERYRSKAQHNLSLINRAIDEPAIAEFYKHMDEVKTRL
jgi:hypothetical protein